MGTRDDMTVAAFIEALDERGIELWFEGARLRFRAPQGAVSAPLRAELAARREEIVAHLRAKAMGSKAIPPLSFSQRSLWISHQQTPESAAYHVAMPMEICSHLDLPALLQALQALVDRHGALRTTYDTVDGEPVQLVAGAHPPKLEIHDVVDVGDFKLRLMIEEDYRRPFDLVQGPVFRILFSRAAQTLHILLLTVHHIAVDAWSMLLLVEELLSLYAEAIGPGVASLPRPDNAYTDYVRWQEAWLAGSESDRLWSYWRQKLALPLVQLELPADRPHPSASTMRGASVPLRIVAKLTGRVKDLARQEETTPFVVLLAAFNVLPNNSAAVRTWLSERPCSRGANRIPACGRQLRQFPRAAQHHRQRHDFS